MSAFDREAYRAQLEAAGLSSDVIEERIAEIEADPVIQAQAALGIGATYIPRDSAWQPPEAGDVRVSPGGWKPTHRHKKRGSEYMLIGIGKMRSEDWYECAGSRDEKPFEPVDVDMHEVAIYRGSDGQLWVRPREEFEDGRFEELA